MYISSIRNTRSQLLLTYRSTGDTPDAQHSEFGSYKANGQIGFNYTTALDRGTMLQLKGLRCL